MYLACAPAREDCDCAKSDAVICPLLNLALSNSNCL